MHSKINKNNWKMLNCNLWMMDYLLKAKNPKILFSNSVKTNVKFALKNICIYTEIRTRDSAPDPGVLLFTESLECDKECFFFLFKFRCQPTENISQLFQKNSLPEHFSKSGARFFSLLSPTNWFFPVSWTKLWTWLALA